MSRRRGRGSEVTREVNLSWEQPTFIKPGTSSPKLFSTVTLSTPSITCTTNKQDKKNTYSFSSARPRQLLSCHYAHPIRASERQQTKQKQICGIHQFTLVAILMAARLRGYAASLRKGPNARMQSSGGRDLAIVAAASSATRTTCGERYRADKHSKSTSHKYVHACGLSNREL